MRRESCSACQSTQLHTFLDLGTSPIADAYTDTADEVSKAYPLEVAVCEDCRLVQLLEVVDGETLFGTGYSFYSSASQPLSDYHKTYAFDVLKKHHDLAMRGVIEVGCNDGDMLRWFKAAGCSVLGVDPAHGPVNAARRRGLNVLKNEFSSQLVDEILEHQEPAGVVIANHVLAHVADVSDVLRGVAHVLAPDGVAYVEVQYLPDLLVNNAFDLVYHEHRNFFSLSSLESVAATHGLCVVDVELTQRQGGSLRVMLMHKQGAPVTLGLGQYRDQEAWLHTDFDAYHGVQGRVERIKQRLWDILWDEVRRDQPIAGHGAPAKATTLLNFCEIDGDVLTHITDTTEAKQGRFVPGTGVQILAPEDAGVAPVQLLLAWNYAREIIRNHRQFDVRWIVPIPAPVIL